MRQVQSGLATAASDAGLAIVEEKELQFDGYIVAFTLYHTDGDSIGTIDAQICDPSGTPSRDRYGNRLYRLAIFIRKPHSQAPEERSPGNESGRWMESVRPVLWEKSEYSNSAVDGRKVE